MAGVGGASIAFGGGGDAGHAAGFSARGSLWKTASTADTAKRHKHCISSSATMESIQTPQQHSRQESAHYLSVPPLSSERMIQEFICHHITSAVSLHYPKQKLTHSRTHHPAFRIPSIFEPLYLHLLLITVLQPTVPPNIHGTSAFIQLLFMTVSKYRRNRIKTGRTGER